ncbi:hypothetical protein H9Q70_005664 [Fusarium xylarioides]|nr:hypothetical protein H9Q70_005664 [Fusarium xylarioides]KAG5780830.1 hypothetical protein H9Q73_005488 [Fusarium xylarioides]
MSPSDIQDWDPASEAVDRTASATDDARETTPTDDQDGTKKRNTTKETAADNAESTERPAKKMKRGKYISRACTSCQQRKIKVGVHALPSSFNVDMEANPDESYPTSAKEEIHADNASRNNYLASPLLQGVHSRPAKT